jgi:hypothetical protein
MKRIVRFIDRVYVILFIMISSQPPSVDRAFEVIDLDHETSPFEDGFRTGPGLSCRKLHLPPGKTLDVPDVPHLEITQDPGQKSVCQAAAAILRQDYETGDGPCIRVRRQVVLDDEFFESIAGSALAPPGRCAVDVEEITVVLAFPEKSVAKPAVLPILPLSPSLPGLDPPGDTIAPAGFTVRMMNPVEIVHAGAVHSFDRDLHRVFRDSLYTRVFPNGLTVKTGQGA